MSLPPRPMWLERGDGRLFAIWHAATGTATAGVLICPPFLHEAMRSQRLFAMLADALSREGCDVLRFDWLGTGNSDGVDEAFDPDAAARDAAVALSELRRRSPGRALHVLGVRAGVFPAATVARSAGVAALWLWQPVTNGGDYLAHLRRLDALERGNPMRYRVAVDPQHAGPNVGPPPVNALLGIDNVTATVVPEPGTAWLVLGGGALLLTRRMLQARH